jgi:quinol monooxygenase YgiN
MANAFIVIAELRVPLENREEFLGLCIYDSDHSLADEMGCRQFDVVTSEEDPGSIVLYEAYDDRAAFDVHLTMPHFAVFAAGVERLGVTRERVRLLNRVHPV